MNTRKYTAIGILFLTSALCLSGCATNPADQYFQTQQNITAVRNAILSAHKLGYITNKQLLAMNPYEQGIVASMQAAYKAFPKTKDGKIDMDAVAAMREQSKVTLPLNMAQKVLASLIQYYTGLISHSTVKQTGE